jgi:hypothetical protein
VEARQAHTKSRLKLFRILPRLEPHHHIIGKAHEAHFSGGVFAFPDHRPFVQRIMQIDVCHQGADTATLRASIVRYLHLSLFQYARA